MAMAQEGPRWEVSGGYQYMRMDLGSAPAQMNLATESDGLPNLNLPSKLNGNGFTASVQENLNSWFSGVLDVSGAFSNLNMDTTAEVLAAGAIPALPNASFTEMWKQQLYTFLFGPQFTLRRSPYIQPFIRVLAGGAHTAINANLAENGAKLYENDLRTSDASVAFGGGAGADIRVTDRVYFRLAADLIRTTLFNDTQDNVRVAAGITYRIGSR